MPGGIRAARGEYVIMGDADAICDFSALMPFVERLWAGAGLVVGNRFRGGIEPGDAEAASLSGESGAEFHRPVVLRDRGG